MFRPEQEQKWDPIEGFRESLAGVRAQKELRRWALISVGALALAGIFALLLAISRIPGADTLFPWPVAFYEKSLIIHVVFSFVVWFVGCGAIFMMVAAHRLSAGEPLLPNMGNTASAALVAAFGFLAVSALLDRGEPSLNNYIPAIMDPIYYIGLLLVAFAGALAATRAITNGLSRTGPLEPIGAVGLSAAAILLIALVAFAITYNRLGGMPTTPAANEDLFWAGGHILQFFNTTIMIGAWVLLAGRSLGQPPVRPSWVMWALAVNTLLALGGLALLFLYEPFSINEREAYSHYQFALAPVPSFIAAMMVITLFKNGTKTTDQASLSRAALLVSLLVFFTGAFLGLFVDGADTRTPAHYHGVIGGVNVALMGFVFAFVLPLTGRALVNIRAAIVGLWLYGIGQLLHSVGLFVAGGYGAPRKVPDTAPSIDDFVNWSGHVGIGIGGVIAVIGGIMFIWIAGRLLISKPT